MQQTAEVAVAKKVRGKVAVAKVAKARSEEKAKQITARSSPSMQKILAMDMQMWQVTMVLHHVQLLHQLPVPLRVDKT